MRRILLVLVFIPAFLLASCNHGEVIEDVRKMPPEISFDNTSGVYTVEVGDVLLIDPKYKYVEGASYLWEAEGKTISTAPSLSFRDTVARELYVLLTVKTDAGSAEDEIKIIVIDSSPIVPDPGTEPELDSIFSWYFPQDEFNVSQGREILLTPYFIPLQGDGADYVWTRGENVLQSNSEAALIFKAEEIGQHNIAVTHLGHRKELVVNVCAAAGTYFREKTTASNRQFEKVLEYTPAPGQFINEDYMTNSAEEACSYAERRMRDSLFVSLGSFGGYIVVGFDHSISDEEGYDFEIIGNSYENNSEPGIVWVMQDENGDGKPNDTWYELKGSDTFSEETIHDYCVTYTRPASTAHTPWVDNYGNKGQVTYLKAYHRQEYYYPLWIKEDSYTLVGTRLAARNYQDQGGWVNPSYEWGYSDNFSYKDGVTTAADGNAGPVSNYFNIDNAVRFDGTSAKLDYIDFIKVQSALNGSSGVTGELSTEVLGFFDLTIK